MLAPMKAVAGELPTGDGWIHEIKWDGMRALVAVRDGAVRIATSNGRDATDRFPELHALGPALGVDAVLDGEIVALDEDGRPDFGLLQQRMHVASARTAIELAARRPVALFLFDLLAVDGRSTTALPVEDRRRLLESLVPAGPHWRVPAAHADGAALLDAARERSLEGVISKRLGSTYGPGTRSRDWVKVKLRHVQEFVVGGWQPGDGGRAGTLGALLLGFHDGSSLRFAGKVGSGFTATELGRVQALLEPLSVDRCPFDPEPERPLARVARWVRPELVAQVTFAEWTSGAVRRLRHPVYLGLRDDVDPASVTDDP